MGSKLSWADIFKVLAVPTIGALFTFGVAWSKLEALETRLSSREVEVDAHVARIEQTFVTNALDRRNQSERLALVEGRLDGIDQNTKRILDILENRRRAQ